MGEFDNKEREEVFSKKVRAGKRTYFFDVKATRSGDYYLTVTLQKLLNILKLTRMLLKNATNILKMVSTAQKQTTIFLFK